MRPVIAKSYVCVCLFARVQAYTGDANEIAEAKFARVYARGFGVFAGEEIPWELESARKLIALGVCDFGCLN